MLHLFSADLLGLICSFLEGFQVLRLSEVNSILHRNINTEDFWRRRLYPFSILKILRRAAVIHTNRYHLTITMYPNLKLQLDTMSRDEIIGAILAGYLISYLPSSHHQSMIILTLPNGVRYTKREDIFWRYLQDSPYSTQAGEGRYILMISTPWGQDLGIFDRRTEDSNRMKGIIEKYLFQLYSQR